MNKDVVVYTEIRIVTILVLACNLHNAAIRQKRNGLPETLSAPDWLVISVKFAFDSKQRPCLVSTDSGPYHSLPK